MAKTEYRTGSHSIFSIQIHFYCVCKYRRKALTPEMISRAREVVERICEARQCLLLEYGGEADHIHLLVDLHPDNNISDFFGSVKSATSRILRQEFTAQVQKFYRKGFWGRQKYYRSAGGAPLAVLMQYIDAHPHD